MNTISLQNEFEAENQLASTFPTTIRPLLTFACRGCQKSGIFAEAKIIGRRRKQHFGPQDGRCHD